MPGYIYLDHENKADSTISRSSPTRIPRPISSGSPRRAALGDITNSHRLNKVRLLKPIGHLISKKGQKSSKAFSSPTPDLPKVSSKRHEYHLDFSPKECAKANLDLDEAENELLSVDTAISPETLENTYVNAPYLERPTKKGIKELNNAVLGREFQPIDQTCEVLEVECDLQPRTINNDVQLLVGDEEDANAGAERDNLFNGNLKYIPGWPFSRDGTRKVIEHWLDTSSSLWNAQLRLSTCGIASTGNELRIDELEAAVASEELNLPRPLERLISAVENLGKCLETDAETKEIVVDVLRSPEIASRFRKLNLTIPIERFDAAINCVQEQPEETEVENAFDRARAEIEDQAFSVTPESFGGDSGYLTDSSDLGNSAQLNKPALTSHQSFSPTNKVLKPNKVVRFDDKLTIIGFNDSFIERAPDSFRSTDIVKEAKALGRAACNIVPGIEHIQKQLFGMDTPTRMQMLDQQFSGQVAADSSERKSKLPSRRESTFGLDGAGDEDEDAPFEVSHDGFISAPLPSFSTRLSTAAVRHGRETLSRFKWNRDWELARERYQLRRALSSFEDAYDVLVESGEIF